MIFHFSFKISLMLVAVVATTLTSCSSKSKPSSKYPTYTQPVSFNQPGLEAGKAAMTSSQLLGQVNVKRDLIPSGRHARKYKRRMTPRYITIHSTQNYSRGADAWRHSAALKNGKLRAYKDP